VLLRGGAFGSAQVDPQDLTSAGDLVFFTARPSQGRCVGLPVERGCYTPSDCGLPGTPCEIQVDGREVWATDGTPAGTAITADVRPGATGSDPGQLVALGGSALYRADDGSHGAELWRSDGPGSAVLVADLQPGAGASAPDHLTVVGDRVFFSADDGAHGRELWKTDGTADGTLLVADIAPGVAGSGPTHLRAIDGVVVFQACTEDAGCEVWASDGTAGGTRRLADVVAGIASSSPREFTAAGDLLFFRAIEAGTGPELWALPRSALAPGSDGDDDGVPDDADNCTEVANLSQLDADADGYGNACDCDLDNAPPTVCNVDDFQLFLADFSSQSDSGIGSDMDASGTVNVDDFGLFLAGFARGAPGPSAAHP
jgi:ELWxxDGT repeat protein